MASQQRDALTILRLNQVKERTGRCRSSLYADIAAGSFPAPIRIGKRAVGWLHSEVEDWIAARVEQHRKPAIKPLAFDMASEAPKRGRGAK